MTDIEEKVAQIVAVGDKFRIVIGNDKGSHYSFLVDEVFMAKGLVGEEGHGVSFEKGKVVRK